MTSPVLFGGRTGLRVQSRAAWLAGVWLPVLVSLAVIARESTDGFAAEYTSGPLRHAFEYLFGPVTPEHWDVVHHILRKTGHFLGYGLAGLAWLRAWLLVWQAPLRLRGVWLWRRLGLVMGLLCTMLTASIDELHQTYIPSRTGLLSDVWLDTAGAATLMLLPLLFWAWGSLQREPQADA